MPQCTPRDAPVSFGRSDLRWSPVWRIEESYMPVSTEFTSASSSSMFNVVIANGPVLVDEVGPERRTAAMTQSERYVIPCARTRFGDGHRVQQPVARRDPVVDANVLGMHVEDRVAQGSDHRRDVRTHPHQVRGVEVPRRRRRRQRTSTSSTTNGIWSRHPCGGTDKHNHGAPRHGAPFACINPVWLSSVFRHTTFAAYSKLLPR